jgi:hypothetical protein
VVAEVALDIVAGVRQLDNSVAAAVCLVLFADMAVAVDIACTLVAVASLALMVVVDLDHSTTWIAPFSFS